MSNSQTAADYELRQLKVSDIVVGRDNPRVIDPDAADIKELAASITASGVIEPVHVRRVGNDLCELIAGERRLVAAKAADCDRIPVIDHGAIGDDEAFEITFLENFGRKDLTVMEQSRAVSMCMIKFGSAAAVAEKLGKSVRWVEQRANIEKGLSDEWKKAIGTQMTFAAWPASHIALVARFPQHIQDECLDAFYVDDGLLTLRELDSKLTERVRLLDKAIWDMDYQSSDKKTPACSKCPNRSSVQPSLWDAPPPSDADAAKNDRCLDTECWQKRCYAWLKDALKELKGEYGKVICMVTRNPVWPDRDDVSKAVGSFQQSANFNVAKKQASGRTAALIVYGTGVGELRWVKDKAPAGTSNRTGGGASSESAASHPKTLKERRKELDSKRWFEVLGEMVLAVNGAKVDDITVEERTLFIIIAVMVFGAGGRYVVDQFDNLKGIVTGHLADGDEPQLAAERDLWEIVRWEIAKGLVHKGAITQVPKAKIAGAKIIAGYLGIDIKAMFAVQKEAITEPKSWKNLNADGTPKLAAKKKSGRKKATNQDE